MLTWVLQSCGLHCPSSICCTSPSTTHSCSSCLPPMRTRVAGPGGMGPWMATPSPDSKCVLVCEVTGARKALEVTSQETGTKCVLLCPVDRGKAWQAEGKQREPKWQAQVKWEARHSGWDKHSAGLLAQPRGM